MGHSPDPRRPPCAPSPWPRPSSRRPCRSPPPRPSPRPRPRRPPSIRGSRVEQRGTVKPRADRFEAKVIKLTNARRARPRSQAAQGEPCADRFAEPWTHHLAKVQKLVHQSLDPFLECPHTSWAGENIAYGYETPRASGPGVDALGGSPREHPEPALPPDRGRRLAGHQRPDLHHPGLPGLSPVAVTLASVSGSGIRR